MLQATCPSNDQVNGCKWSICNMFPSSKVAIATALSHHMASEAMKECIEEYLDEYNSVVLSVSSNQLESSYNVLQCLTYRELLACLLPCVHRIGMFWLPSSYQTGKSQNNFCLFDCYDVCLKGATPQWSPVITLITRGQHIANATGDVFGCLRALCPYLPRPWISVWIFFFGSI